MFPMPVPVWPVVTPFAPIGHRYSKTASAVGPFILGRGCRLQNFNCGWAFHPSDSLEVHRTSQLTYTSLDPGGTSKIISIRRTYAPTTSSCTRRDSSSSRCRQQANCMYCEGGGGGGGSCVSFASTPAAFFQYLPVQAFFT